MEYLIRLILATISIFVTAALLPGVRVEGWGAALVVAVILGIINMLIRPALLLLTFPINVVTFGLFSFVVMAFCVLLASWFVSGFHVDGFWWAMAFAIVLSIVKKCLATASF